MLLGYSVQHRPIIAIEIGDPDSPADVLIVGCIDGNEPAGIAIASTLADSPPRLRPRLTIYYHQPLTVVDDSEGPRAIERRNAQLTGLPRRPLTDYPGSAVGWQDALLGPTAFVVELPPRPLSPPSVRRYSAAIDAVLPRY
jgi:hypothetical protein